MPGKLLWQESDINMRYWAGLLSPKECKALIDIGRPLLSNSLIMIFSV